MGQQGISFVFVITMENKLSGTPGELVFTVSITRKDTGKVETFEMIGKPVEEKEKHDGCNDIDGCAQRGN